MKSRASLIPLRLDKIEKLYKIEEQTTMGWEPIDPEEQGMTQEQTQEKWSNLVSLGYNPNGIRIVRVQ